MTAEGPSPPFTLGPRQKTPAQTYAVGFYNDRGGYLIGKVWADADNPRPDIVRQDGGFPVGTVVAKLLFTTAPVSEVDYLSNPIEWTAYVKDKFAPNVPDNAPPTPRHVALVRLIQVDIMVRDDRAKATGGWVFGTFIYNGALGATHLAQPRAARTDVGQRSDREVPNGRQPVADRHGHQPGPARDGDQSESQ